VSVRGALNPPQRNCKPPCRSVAVAAPVVSPSIHDRHKLPSVAEISWQKCRVLVRQLPIPDKPMRLPVCPAAD
jgi:hypothetical protein